LPILKKTEMKGFNRFDFFLQKLNYSIQEAEKQEDPGWWLYKNDARTPVFMLEGLARLYNQVHEDEDDIKKMKEDFKMLEDAIGTVDYYDNLAKDLEKLPAIEKKYISFIHEKCKQKNGKLNEILIDRKWISNNRNRIDRCREKLQKIEWKKEDEDMDAFRDYYRHEIKEINDFIDSRNGKFTKLEEDVHEFRRKIRWLSIYPKSLNGSIQLAGNLEDKPELEKYFSEDVINSPYNRMPSGEGLDDILYLSKPDFYALSWMIAQTGKLKDQGLNIYGLAEAISETESLSEDDAVVRAMQSIGNNGEIINNLLRASSEIIITYQQTKSLDHLIA